ncbi:MAG TPA: pyridoxal phosphate-dependent aminotransferase [Burkholderiaceae bacterium]|nr:pyridoxal phosphate-dependent aminotransferase [Burkholderiaceae bacterium]
MPAAAARTALIEPFYVMEVVKEATELALRGHSVIHLSIGEPDFTAPEAVRRAAIAAIERGETQYTGALGLQPLRERIAQWYATRFGCDISANRIVVTAGASGALLLACAALLERDADLLMPDPSYPCNRHFATALGGRARLVPCGPEQRFQLNADAVAANWTAATGGVLVASPSNPTGTSIEPRVLAELMDTVKRRNGFVISDEIYQGLSYGHTPTSALQSSDDVLVINSFSKYFSMTGWRLGWIVAPEPLVPVLEKLAQNLYICPSTIAQHAALGCFDEASIAIYEERRAEFQRRRDFLVPALKELGFRIPVSPDGAFYVYADIGRFADDSFAFVRDLLRATGVCLVPGKDFGVAAPDRYVRISYATSVDRLEEAVERMRRHLR